MKLHTAITVLLAIFPKVASQNYFPFVAMTGAGYCTDSGGNEYSKLLYIGQTSGPQECFDFCTSKNEDELVGVTVETQWNYCSCHLNDATGLDNSGYTLPGDGNPNSLFPIGIGVGSGNVENTNGQSNWQCYRNEVSHAFAMFICVKPLPNSLDFFFLGTELHCICSTLDAAICLNAAI